MPDVIGLAHGNGGKQMRELIQQVISPALVNSENTPPDIQHDAASLVLSSDAKITTDSYIVDPAFFPGGDIGKLAVCGTINDLLVSGALPRYMSVNLIIEEGYAISDLKRILHSLGDQARHAGISILTGDTKVMPAHSLSGICIVTTGIGETIRNNMNISQIKHGDHIYINGSLGDHAAAIMLARQAFGFEGYIESDCAALQTTIEPLLEIEAVRFMRDPTRGGIATVCHDIISESGMGITLEEAHLPVRPAVSELCDALGLSPYYMACEGRVLVVADATLSPLEIKKIAPELILIGKIDAAHRSLSIITEIGGQRIIPELDADQLPRIC